MVAATSGPRGRKQGECKENNDLFDENVVGLIARLFEAEVSQAVYWNIEQDHVTFEAIRGLGHIPPKRSQRYLQLSWTDIHATL